MTAHESQSGSLGLPRSAPKDSDSAGGGGAGAGVWPGHQDLKSTPGVFNVQPSLRPTELEAAEAERPVTLL